MKLYLLKLALLTACLITSAIMPVKSEASGQKAPSSDQKVKEDVATSSEKGAKLSDRFAYYVVPPMSNIKRTMSTYPSDGTLGAPVRIIAAKGEYEPASIVLYPYGDAKKVELKISDLKGKNGSIPASAIDARIVKVWYQAGTAWYSYFADTKGRELVPELLLNDETLVKVDTKTEDNYLRVDYPAPVGTKHFWISNPYQIEIPFEPFVEPVADAKSLQPFSLKAGEFKQLWFTLEAPKGAEGTYEGTITLVIDGKTQAPIPLQVRVLPFELPIPKTNYDLSRIYYTSIYNETYLRTHLTRCGGDKETALRHIFNEYVNMRKHNVYYPMLDSGTTPDGFEHFRDQLRTYIKAGLHTDTLFLGSPAAPRYDWMTSPEVAGKPLEEQPIPYELYRTLEGSQKIIGEELGHKNVYFFGWDEPVLRLLIAQRLPWKKVHDMGFKTYSTGHSSHLLHQGYNEDFLNYGGRYSKEVSQKWHEIGARITSYAAPHTGPENPDFVRRTHGFDLYMADCDGTNNYMLNGSPWNDFSGAVHNFRSFNYVYPTKEGPIDTIHWEGFREGIDDVRYATLLKQLANQALASNKTETVYQGRKALLWIATQDPKKCDLNELRLEMINHILKLKASL